MDSKRCEEETHQQISPYPDAAHWVSRARWVLEEKMAAMLLARLHAVQTRESFKEEFVYLFTFPNVSSTDILTTVFTYLFSRLYLWMF